MPAACRRIAAARPPKPAPTMATRLPGVRGCRAASRARGRSMPARSRARVERSKLDIALLQDADLVAQPAERVRGDAGAELVQAAEHTPDDEVAAVRARHAHQRIGERARARAQAEAGGYQRARRQLE